MVSGAARIGVSCRPTVRLAPGKVSQESGRPETSRRVADATG